MVICKFFLQGTCRFGENCKFEHQLLNDGRQHHGSVLRPQNFAASANVPTGNPNTGIDQNTLIRAVINDTVAAEKGGQWLLSCYAPFKEKPNYPGFEEQSFEEVRWAFYEAQPMGTVNQCKQQFQMSLQAAVLKLRSLQNPSQETINTIKTIYNSAPGTPASVFTNTGAPSNFNGSPSSVFANNQNILFSNTNTSNVYGQTGNFGTTNVFAQNPQQQTSTAKSIFSAANQTLFGAPQQQQSSMFSNNQLASNANLSSANPFGQTFSTQNPGFGAAQPNQQPTTFVQQQAGFGTQPQASALPFGGQQQSTMSPFHPQQQTGISLFNTQQPTGNLGFSNQQNTSPFGVQAQPNAALLLNPNQQPTEAAFVPQQQQTASPFGNQAIPQVPSFNNPTNAFGNNLQPTLPQTTSGSHTSSIFGSSGLSTIIERPENVTDESVYSKLEELGESDIKSFENDHFEFGQIPEKPPTIQMCF